MLAKLKKLIKESPYTDPSKIAGLLKQYVHDGLFLGQSPPKQNYTRFFPDHRTIYNHIYNTQAEMLKYKILWVYFGYCVLISVIDGELHLNLGINQYTGMMFLAGQSRTKY